MRMLITTCVALLVSGQSPDASRTRAHVEALASQQLEGRLAGSNGERLAGDYIAASAALEGVKEGAEKALVAEQFVSLVHRLDDAVPDLRHDDCATGCELFGREDLGDDGLPHRSCAERDQRQGGR